MDVTATQSQKNTAVAGVAAGSIMFGFLSIFTRFLQNDKGIPSFDVAELRLLFATSLLFLFLLVFSRGSLRIRTRDIPFFVLFGIFKFMSDGFLFYAQREIEVSLATLLQMTAPYYVMLFSLFLFRERITIQKLMALFLAFLGCIFVTGVLFGNTDLGLAGVFSALLSGLFYAMFTLGGRIGSDRGYSPQTVLFYMFLFGLVTATVFTGVTSDLGESLSKVGEPDVFAACLVLGSLLTLLPFYLFTYATSKVEASLVSMVSVLELVMATTVGYFYFGESLSIFNIVGMALVMLSIVVADVKISRKYIERKRMQRLEHHHHV